MVWTGVLAAPVAANDSIISVSPAWTSKRWGALLVVDPEGSPSIISIRGASSGGTVLHVDRGLLGTDGGSYPAGTVIEAWSVPVSTVAGGAHPNLATHEALGLVTDADLATHAATPHGGEGGEHPDLATHEGLGLVTDSDLTTHAATAHGTQAHAISGVSHTGSLDHSALGSVTANQHHNQDHASRHATGQADALTAANIGAAASGHNHDAAYEASGTVATHAAAADPHTGYLKENDASWTDLTDGGQTSLHSHAGGPAGEAYSVGDLYLTTTNHADAAAVATHFGYGTWARFGAGRFLLLTAATAGETGGSATHAHTFTQPSDHAALTHAGAAVAAHNVTQPSAHTEVMNHTHSTDSQGAHVHDEFRNSATTGGLDGWAAGDTSTNTPTLTGYDTGSAGAHTHTAQNPAGGVASISHSGAAVDAHSVTQPSQHAAQSHAGGAVANGNTDPLSITAFAWTRTA